MNPLGEDQSVMRTTMVHSLLLTASLNMNRRTAPKAGLFEIGSVYVPRHLPLTELPEERARLCMVIYGEGEDFYTLKGLVDAVFGTVGAGLEYRRYNEPYLHPGRSAAAYFEGQPVAVLGQVHPDTAARYELTGRAYVAELDAQWLFERQAPQVTVKPLPKFPSVERDIAVIVAEDTEAGAMLADIKKAAGGLLEGLTLFDIYRGAQLGQGKKSAAFSLVLRAEDRTLTDEETNAVMAKVLKALERNHNAVLRS